jgi:hypothetical protein
MTVLLTGLMARQLGGNAYAQGLAALAVFIAGSYLGNNQYYSMNSFDLLFWTLGGFITLLILKNPKLRNWLFLGLVIGLGLLNKISMLWFSGGLAVGLLLSPARRLLFTKGPWLAGTFAVLLFLPHILWQMENNWPTLEFMRNATSYKMADNPPHQFALQQIRSMNYFSFPVWIAGLVFYFSKRGSQFRPLGWIYVFTFLVLVLSRRSRSGYLAPAYTMLFAAGAVYLEAWIRARNWNWIKPVYVVILILAGLWILPFAIPVLPVEMYIRYASLMGVRPSTAERKELAELPQHYADMHGWQAMTDTVARVYNSLSPEEQKKSAIFTQNYGEAGAISFFGKKYGLPAVVSGHNNHWLWGPPEGLTGEVVIIVGGDPEDHNAIFESVEHADTHRCTYCMPYENNLPIFVGRNMKVPLKELWPQVKHYD